MKNVIVRHRVRNYAQWRKVFDEQKLPLRELGVRECRIFHSETDPENILLILEVQDLKKARAFMDSPELKQEMERAGTLEKPEVFYLEELQRPVLKEIHATAGKTR